MKNYLEIATLDKAAFMESLVDAVKSSVNTQDKIVCLTKEALLHFHKHGDAIYMNHVYKDLPTSQRKQAIKAWFEAFSPVKWDGKANSFVKDREENAKPTFPAHDKRELEENAELIMKTNELIDKAFDKPYYEFTREIDPTLVNEVDFLKNRVNSLLNSYAKLTEKRTVQPEVTEIVQALKTVKRNLETLAIAA